MSEYRFPPPANFTAEDQNALHDAVHNAVPKALALSVEGGEIVLQGEDLAPAEQDAVSVAIAAFQPIPLFQGERVRSPADVDRVTAGRIRALLAPEWAGDSQMAVMRILRLVEDALADIDTVAAKPGATQAEIDAAQGRLAGMRDLRSQIDAERQAGTDFKAARGW